MFSVFQGWFGNNLYAGFQQYTLADSELVAKVRRAVVVESKPSDGTFT